MLTAGENIATKEAVFHRVEYAKPIPCKHFMEINTLPQQLRHVMQETGEAWEAAYNGDMDHAAEELTDVITACTTALAMLGYDEQAREELQIAVNAKNMARGYHND